jgi:hypothetical protein
MMLIQAAKSPRHVGAEDTQMKLNTPSHSHLVRRRRITLIITLIHDNAAKSPPLAEDFSEEIDQRLLRSLAYGL